MPVVRVAPGEVVSTSHRFYDNSNLPMTTGIVPAKYTVLSPSGATVVAGNAIQDIIDSALFTATFTIPQTAVPTTNNTKYTLRWTVKSTTGDTYTVSESFDVINTGDDETATTTKSVVYVPGVPCVDTLEFPIMASQPTAVYTVMDESGATIGTGVVTGTVSGSKYVYTATIASLSAPTGVQGHFIGMWVLTGGTLTVPEVETHAIYYMSSSIAVIMHSLREMLDRGTLQAIHPYLSWNAADFIHHILKGFEYVNGAPPRTTNIAVNSALPVGLMQFVEKAAAVSALRAQLLAEAQSSFDFQGLQTQLTVDRTPMLSDLIGQYSGDLAALPEWKKAWVQSGSPTGTPAAAASGTRPILSTHITTGPYTDYESPSIESGYMPSGVLGLQGLRRRTWGTRL